MKKYDHREIEKKWQDVWEKNELYKTSDEKKDNFYTLVEFPYPSGNLHVGHWYAFAVPDIFARFKRMMGKNVLYPIGFDSFGLPAENAAIKNKVDPKEWTYGNIDFMRNQLKTMGNSFDWAREIITSDPEYYKWNQWLFNKFHENDLVYRGKRIVNWDPIDQTVLADEQVLADGTAERSGALVEKKDLEQWMFRITEYADRLIDDLDKLDWPKEIIESQKNWIGRSTGANIVFKIKDSSEEIKVFTTRPDTLFGATYVVLAPESKLIDKLKIENAAEVEKYINNSKKRSEIERAAEGKEKTGVELIGVKAINPANNEEISIFVADYVLGHYGTGAIMAVPAHDERDFTFANKFKLPIKQVIAPFFVDKDNQPKDGKEWIPRKIVLLIVKHPIEDKIIQLVWKKVPWKTFVIGGVEEEETYEEAAIRELYEETGFKNIKKIEKLGWEMESHFFARHKDVNRQAFPQFFSIELKNLEKDEISDEEKEKHEVTWVPSTDLSKTFWPVSELPEIITHIENGPHAYVGDGILINSGQFNGLDSKKEKGKITEFVGGKITTTYKLRDWIISRQRYWGTPIPIVYDPDGKAHRIPDEHLPWLLPLDVDYKPKGVSPLGSSKELIERTEGIFGKGWRPETDTMDTFMDSSWYYLRYLDFANSEEFSSMKKQKHWMPVDFYSGGAEHTTMHLLYSRFFYKALYDFGLVTDSEPYVKRMNRGLIMAEDGRKMSKRWGNVIDPDELVKNIGADTVKMYLAFIGPYNEVGSYPWDSGGIIGIRKFLERIWNLQDKIGESDSKDVEKLLHQTIKKVGEDIEILKFNTAISQIMILVNMLDKETKISSSLYEKLIKMLSPFAPHITEEIWENVGNKKSIHLEKWPKYDADKVIEKAYTIPVQINGKVRATIEVDFNSSEREVSQKALKEENVKKWIGEAGVKKTIYVENRIINFIVDSI